MTDFILAGSTFQLTISFTGCNSEAQTAQVPTVMDFLLAIRVVVGWWMLVGVNVGSAGRFHTG